MAENKEGGDPGSMDRFPLTLVQQVRQQAIGLNKARRYRPVNIIAGIF